MEDQVSRLVAKLQAKCADGRRLLVAIAGIPGTGKTTLAMTIVNRLNQDQSGLATCVPMDGYHFTRAELSAMPDPVRAHARRGAEFTFNGWAFLDLVKAIRAQDAMSPTVFAASFDHAVKDPKENDIPILASTRVVVFEGIYLALDKEPWRDAASLMDEIWYVDVDFDTAKRRLVERHVRSGIVANEVEAEARARENDLVNGEEIVRLRLKNIDEVIISREDNTWKHEA